MRASILFGAAAVMLATPGTASVITVGSSNAVTCYRAAEDRSLVADSWRACDTALYVEALSAADRAGTLVNRGILFMLSKQPDRAIRDFEEAARIDPAQPEAFLNRAIVAWQSGDSVTAAAQAGRAIELKTRKPALAFYVRGIASEDQGRIREAYADLQRASQLAPSWPDPRRELARYQVRQR